MMASWTKVMVQYCDGGSWSGNNQSTTTFGGQQLHFRGRKNFEGLMKALLNNHGFGNATDIVVSGGSAGALATYLQADTAAAMVAPTTKVVAMPDAGFFLDNDASRASGWVNSMKWVFEQQNASAGLSPRCLARYNQQGEGWKCFLPQYALGFIQTPIFALQSMYDAYQTGAELRSTDPVKVDAYGANLTATLEAALLQANGVNRNGAFLDACWHHGGAWRKLKIEGMEAWDAMHAWYTGNVTRQYYWKQAAPSGFPCKDCCPMPCGCTGCCFGHLKADPLSGIWNSI
jgi:hypothetical protein